MLTENISAPWEPETEFELDIGDRDFLSEQAVAVGLFPNADEAKAWLATDAKRKVGSLP